MPAGLLPAPYFTEFVPFGNSGFQPCCGQPGWEECTGALALVTAKTGAGTPGERRPSGFEMRRPGNHLLAPAKLPIFFFFNYYYLFASPFRCDGPGAFPKSRGEPLSVCARKPAPGRRGWVPTRLRSLSSPPRAEWPQCEAEQLPGAAPVPRPRWMRWQLPPRAQGRLHGALSCPGEAAFPSA